MKKPLLKFIVSAFSLKHNSRIEKTISAYTEKQAEYFLKAPIEKGGLGFGFSGWRDMRISRVYEPDKPEQLTLF